ncbi:receptor-like protein EIX2 [Bidens hawaiensis]|uniref:receptor-like protein EIX2 n=1 Tax=Bidens hawaiensis TaxID=980011 RepID=UPI004049E012
MATAHKCVGVGNLTRASCYERERLALVKFKQSIIYDHGMLSSWEVGNDCCRWEGVGCDNTTGRVEGNLLAEEYSLGGVSYGFFLRYDERYYLDGHELNSCLKELVNLKHLDLSGNNFRGSRFPEFIGSLKQLRYLNFSNVGLIGNIPHHIGNLSNLKVLDLSLSSDSSNDLMIDDMAWISSLSKLEHLDLSGVDLSRAQNLDSLLYMPSLLNLSLSRCGFSIAHLGSHHLNYSRELASIKHLDLSENYLRGELPGLFVNMTSLESLDLSLNNVTMAWSFENLLQMILYVLELHLSDCNIQKINLSPNNLSLSIHSSIQHLDLSLNEIEGRFPYVLTNMSSLLSVDLSYNGLNSSIPIMPNLFKLDISGNNFRNIEDVGLWRQCNLKHLFVSSSNLEGEIIGPSTNVSECSHIHWRCCSIPVFIGRLTSLRVFSVSSNFLNGTIPNSIGQLTKLYSLDVSNNSLHGVLSEDHFANLSMLKRLNADYNYKLLFNISPHWIPPFQLKVVRLHSCKIEDRFPKWFRTQTSLKELVLSNASIYGPLPTWFRLMPMISIIDLSHNKLTGTLVNLHSVFEVIYEFGGMLILQDNLFQGSIPWWLCTRTDLKVLDLSRNRLTGEIPSCLWSLPLDMVLLSSNRLYGGIPNPIGYNPSLRWLQLNDNNLSGELPYFGYFRSLMVLDLGENKISGIIPEWNVDELMVLRLHKNNFSGRIPSFLCQSRSLRILDLAQNNLQGSIPSCFEYFDGMKANNDVNYWGLFGYGHVVQVLKGIALSFKGYGHVIFLRSIDLSSNKLFGEIPKGLTTLDGLVSLNLSYNCFTGNIPEDIGNMKTLESLDLSANKLTGVIPPSMAALNDLESLNPSHNNLSGQIPTGCQLSTFISSSYADNPYLCGEPLPKKCFPHENTRSKYKYKNGKVWFYLDIMSGFATGFWGIIGVLLFKKQWRQKLFNFSKVAMDMIYVAIAIRVLKMKRAKAAT